MLRGVSAERGSRFYDFDGGFDGTYAERIGPPDPLDAAIGRAVMSYFELTRAVRNVAQQLGLPPAAPGCQADSPLLHHVARLENGLREGLRSGAICLSWDLEAWLGDFVSATTLADTLIMAIVEDANFPTPVSERRLARSARLIRGRDVPEWPLLPSEIINVQDFISCITMDVEETLGDLGEAGGSGD